MKKILKLIFHTIIVSSFCLFGCSQKAVNVEEKVFGVEVTEVVNTNESVMLNYIGVVDSKEKINYSFKITERLAEMYVSEGQHVKKGQPLAKIETTDLSKSLAMLEGQANSAVAGVGLASTKIESAQISIDIAYANYIVAQSQYELAINGATQESINRYVADVNIAKESYEIAKQTYNNTEILYNAGTVSKNQLDQSLLQFQKAETDYTKATEVLKEIENGTRKEDIDAALARKEAAWLQYENAIISKEQASSGFDDAQGKYLTASAQMQKQQVLLEDSTIYAQRNGVVLKTPFKESEIVPAGNSVVIIRDEDLVIKIGVIASELNYIKLNEKVNFIINDKEFIGTIIEISEVIDTSTRTYEVKIQSDDDVKEIIKVGNIVDVKIEIGKEKGIWLPINYIRSDGEDYVFVANNERVLKKYITIQKYNGELARVIGLVEGDIIITKGASNLVENAKINISGE